MDDIIVIQYIFFVMSFLSYNYLHVMYYIYDNNKILF